MLIESRPAQPLSPIRDGCVTVDTHGWTTPPYRWVPSALGRDALQEG